MSALRGKVAVVTGGTDGIGAATALALTSAGADVVVIGRSPDKAARVTARADTSNGGSMRAVTTDLSLMRHAVTTVQDLAGKVDRVDILVHAVGILLTRTEHTAEGIEKDFAVSYLARFAFLEEAHRLGLLAPHTRLVNISASGPRIPSYARMEFASVDEVRARVGMRSHGQAQLANDLLTMQAPARYGVTAVGYGPGSVRTQIRREVPRALRVLMAPFFALATRSPEQVAGQLLGILADPGLPRGTASWFTRSGTFTPSPFIADARRQDELLTASLALLREALAATAAD
jgi:NAD(P)-dependent dehydrogenase (short-subunit alcohol dehydrogenase family)